MIWFGFGVGLAVISIGCIAWGVARANNPTHSSAYAPIPGLVLFIISLDLIMEPFLSSLAINGLGVAALSLVVKLGVGITVYLYLMRNNRAEKLLGRIA